VIIRKDTKGCLSHGVAGKVTPTPINISLEEPVGMGARAALKKPDGVVWLKGWQG
jgi:hypothetical protein